MARHSHRARHHGGGKSRKGAGHFRIGGMRTGKTRFARKGGAKRLVY